MSVKWVSGIFASQPKARARMVNTASAEKGKLVSLCSSKAAENFLWDFKA